MLDASGLSLAFLRFRSKCGQCRSLQFLYRFVYLRQRRSDYLAASARAKSQIGPLESFPCVLKTVTTQGLPELYVGHTDFIALLLAQEIQHVNQSREVTGQHNKLVEDSNVDSEFVANSLDAWDGDLEPEAMS